MTHRFRTVPLFLLLAATGCAGWHAVKDTPAEYIQREKPDVVRLSLGDSSLVLSRPAVHGDSIVGKCKSVKPRRLAAVRSEDIRAMEIHSLRGTKRGRIFAGSVVAAAVALGVLAAIPGRRAF